MAGKSAEAAQAEASLLTRRLFAAPPPRRLVLPIGGVSLLAATFLSLPDFAWDALSRNLLVVAAPLYGSALLTAPLANLLGGHSFLRRATLQAFIDALTVFSFVAVVAFAELVVWLAGGNPFDYSRPRLLLLGFAASAWLRHAVWISTSDHRHTRSAPVSAFTWILGWGAVKLSFGTTALDDLVAVLLFAAFLAAGIAFTVAANAPLRHAFHTNGLRLMRYLLEHMSTAAEFSEEGRRELESFFDSFARPAEVRVGALAFRGPKGNVGLLVAPHAHPGPFGHTGGSDMPSKLASALADLSPHVLVPHGPSTHDFNPATTRECLTIATRVRELLQAGTPIRGGSRSVRRTDGKATVTAQMFGDVAFVTASLAPNPTDDIDGATGHAAIHAGKEAGARDCLFVDAHNSAEVAMGMVHYGSEESLQMIQGTHDAVRAALGEPAASLRVGFGHAPLGSVREGIGAQGLQVLAVEADGQRTAYLVFDGNNMVRGLRDEILQAARRIVDQAEVLTTDNHSVNARIGGYNPIGMHLDWGSIVAASYKAVQEAVGNLGATEFVAASGTVHGLRVFGHENTARLTTSINATISILRPMAVFTMGIALAASTLLLLLIP